MYLLCNGTTQAVEVSDLVRRIQLHRSVDISSHPERMSISTQNVNVLLNRPFQANMLLRIFYYKIRYITRVPQKEAYWEKVEFELINLNKFWRVQSRTYYCYHIFYLSILPQANKRSNVLKSYPNHTHGSISKPQMSTKSTNNNMIKVITAVRGSKKTTRKTRKHRKP